ncbi:hypothetical protein SEA_MARGARET_36 [Gordonia phage Margaret]|nr:hypothetical protein SEA_MARGARET_36 [Gordonia phage Margaret]
MQTFLVAPRNLDPKRLANQINECQSIWVALTEGRGYINHPATLMWDGYLIALAQYAVAMCEEHERRTMSTHALHENFRQRRAQGRLERPWWWGHAGLLESHRSNLIRKRAEWYLPRYPDTALGLPYLWPHTPTYTMRLSRSEYRRGGYHLPHTWGFSERTLEVFCGSW